MVDWYVVAECEWLGPNFGQSEYIDMNGYTEGTMGSQDIQTHGEAGDPFLAYGIDTQTWTFGQAQMEIGLLESHRIRINSSGVYIWTAGDVWEDILSLGGASNLDELGDVVITGTPANNEVLAWDTTSSKWINQTAAEAGLSVSGHTHGDLHTEDHDNTHHTTNYEEANANIQSHVASPLSDAHHTLYILEAHNNTYHSVTFVDAAGAVSAVNAAGLSLASTKVITSADEDLIFTFGQALINHASYSGYFGISHRDNAAQSQRYALIGTSASTMLNSYTNTSLRVNNQVQVALNGTNLTMSVPIAMGTNKITGLGNGSAAQDAMAFGQKYTLESHNNTYHSTNYHTESDGTGSVTVHSGITDAGSGIIISTGERTALHAAVTQVYNLKALDDRDFKPNTSDTYGFVKAYFTSLGGMTGVSDSDYQDLLILNAYTDASGGDINALTFDKSTQLIKHWLADQAAATWGTPKTLAYVEDTYSQTEIDDRVFEKGSTFPGSPVEGDLHYDTADEAMYRYSGDALAWIQIGASGTGYDGAFSLDQAFDNGKIIDGANSEANAVQIGEVTDKIKIWHDGINGYIKSVGQLIGTNKYIGSAQMGGSDGFILGNGYWSVLLSDVDAKVYISIVVPETRTDWRISIVGSTPGSDQPVTVSGVISAGAAGDGTGVNITNIFNAVNMDFATLFSTRYDYPSTSTFSATAGHTLRIMWEKDDNANGSDGSIYIYGIYLWW